MKTLKGYLWNLLKKTAWLPLQDNYAPEIKPWTFCTTIRVILGPIKHLEIHAKTLSLWLQIGMTQIFQLRCLTV